MITATPKKSKDVFRSRLEREITIWKETGRKVSQESFREYLNQMADMYTKDETLLRSLKKMIDMEMNDEMGGN